MPQTFVLSDQFNQVVQKLNLKSIEDIAAVYDAETLAELTGYDAIGGLTKLWNAAQRFVVEDCVPLAGRFTYAWISTNNADNTRASVGYTDFTKDTTGDDVPTGAVLRWPLAVAVTQQIVVTASGTASIVTRRTPLERCDEWVMQISRTNYEYEYGVAPTTGPPIVAGTPVKYWIARGGNRIGLWPLPYLTSPGMPVSVDGLYYPPDLAAPADNVAATPTFTYLDADGALLTVLQTALTVISKAADDARLTSRLPLLNAEFGEVQARLRSRVPTAYKMPGGPYEHLLMPVK